MFTLSILQTNGSRKGKRYRLELSPFVIGRDGQCELVFPSRTISRRHCAILFNDSDVLIKDLGSRNGTVVDGEQIPADVPRQLTHHSRLQLGKYTFRVSIRDAQTHRPHRPNLIDLSTLSGQLVIPNEKAKGAAQLLSELDDLAAKLDVKQVEVEPIGNERIDSLEPSSTSITDPATRQLNPAENEHSEIVVTESSTADNDSVAIDAKPGPQKIPTHLRPQGPKDSQSAAATALKNLFVK